MTKRKQYPLRGYDTFEEDPQSGQVESSNNHPISYQREDSDKSRSAAAEAQRLGSTGSWADQFSGGATPATNMTPTASTVNGDGESPHQIQYPRLLHDSDPSDPPPVYTPEASTNGSAAPPSPVVTRVAPAFQPVSNPVTDNSSQHLPQSGSQSQAQHQSSCQYQVDDDTEDGDDPSASLLPEPVQYPYQQSSSQAPVIPVSSNERRFSKRRLCLPRHNRRGVAFRRDDQKCRARRFKRACWFIFSLLLCLWLLIPGLCKSLSNVTPSDFISCRRKKFITANECSCTAGRDPVPQPWLEANEPISRPRARISPTRVFPIHNRHLPTL